MIFQLLIVTSSLQSCLWLCYTCVPYHSFVQSWRSEHMDRFCAHLLTGTCAHHVLYERRTRTGPCCGDHKCCTRVDLCNRGSPCGWCTWRGPGRAPYSARTGMPSTPGPLVQTLVRHRGSLASLWPLALSQWPNLPHFWVMPLACDPLNILPLDSLATWSRVGDCSLGNSVSPEGYCERSPPIQCRCC